MGRKRNKDLLDSIPTKKRKHVICNCPNCGGIKKVDPRTKRNHELQHLPGLSSDTLIQSQGSQFGGGENADLMTTSADTLIPSQDSQFGDRENADLMTTSETANIHDMIIDNFEDDQPFPPMTSRKLAKGKFKEPPPIHQESGINLEDDISPNEQDEDNSEDDIMASSAVEDNSEDDILMSDSDDATFHFNVPQIDPETFDPPFRPGQSQSNEWVILWLLKFQK
jgi:hypothetical protein